LKSAHRFFARYCFPGGIIQPTLVRGGNGLL
jgi:hypothetical protein